MPLSDADKIINLEDLAAFKAKMDESVLHKIGTETVSGEKVFSGSQTTPSGNSSALLVVKDPNLVKGETPPTNHFLSLGFIDSTGDSYAQDTASRLAVMEYKSPSDVDPTGYMQMADMGFNGGGTAFLRVGHDKDNISYSTAPATSDDRANSTDIVTRGFMEASEWNWQKTKKAGAVAFKPVPESDLEPVVDFMFTETPPAEGEKGPDNPSTITGVTQTKVTRCGKNLLIMPYVQSTTTINDVTFTVNADGTVTANGTASDVTRFYLSYSSSGAIYKNGLTYMLSGCPSGGAWDTYYLGVAGPVLNNSWNVDLGAGKSFTPDGDGYLACTIVINSGITVSNLVFKPQLELGTTATSFEPYEGNDYTIQLGDTYYGGSFDVATGVMTVTWVGKILDGTETITKASNYVNVGRFAIADVFEPNQIEANSSTNQFCTHYIYSGSGSDFSRNNFYVARSSGTVVIFSAANESKNDFVAWLTQQYSNGTPVKVVCKLDIPLSIQLTPTQIRSLPALDKYEPRINTVYTDQEAVQVGYQRYVGEENLVHRMGDESVAGAKTFSQGPYGTASTLSSAAVDLAGGTVFSKTIAANTSFTITGVPSGVAAVFNLILTNGGAYTVTWPSSVKWADGTAPDLSASGVDVLTFLTPDGGATWFGTVAVGGAA